MIDWGIAATIAGGGFGTTVFVMVVLCLVAWVVGLILQRMGKTPPEDKPKT
jgi:hypothetical protein